jgi:predicted NBD/HSP70 family sugar kinase
MARLQSRQISQLHLYQVLHTVRLARDALSRAEICERTGLSQPATSTLTRRLLESGALVEAGIRPSVGGGRRERELAINPEHLFAVGAKVSMCQLTIALTDFAGGVRHTTRIRLESPLSHSAFARMLSREVEACLSAAVGVPRQRLRGVGVALPGFVDSMGGEVLWCPMLRPGRGASAGLLATALTEALGVPAFIENDANMLALAEQWFGQAGHRSNVLVVTLEHGLGLGLVVNGELYRGHLGMAGEIGHIQIEPGGRPCRCGKRGCLEASVAKYAMVAQAQEQGLLPGTDAMAADAIEAAYIALAARATAGERGPLDLFHRQGQLLGFWLGNLVNMMSPQWVILDTGNADAAGLYGRVLTDAMDQTTALPERRKTPLLVCRRGEEVWARGAAALVLQRLDESAAIVDAVSRHGFESEVIGRRPDE